MQPGCRADFCVLSINQFSRIKGTKYFLPLKVCFAHVFQLRHQFFCHRFAIEVATGGCWIVGYSIALGNAIRAMFRRHFYPLKKIFHRHYSEIFVYYICAPNENAPSADSDCINCYYRCVL